MLQYTQLHVVVYSVLVSHDIVRVLIASRVRLEGERVKLETERNGLDQRLRESKEACQGLENDLKLLRGERAQLEQANKQLHVGTGCQ